MAIRATRAPADPAPPSLRTHVLIIEARFYEVITDALAEGAIAELDAAGVSWDRIAVPGALELPQVLASAAAAELVPEGAPCARYAGVVALGCVIRGETSHFETVCNNSNHWLMDVAIRYAIPVGNGILTVETEAQALARATGGRRGKGGDAARACLRLIEISRRLRDGAA
jgi:6,7-dimethyl-8-ribityllumazine synthase